MTRASAVASLAAAALAAAAAPAAASEVWAGVYAHDVTFVGEALGIGAAGREGGANVHLGVRSEPMEALRRFGRPSAYVFVSANTDGDTSFGGAGLGWRVPLGAGSRWFLRPGIGLVVHDGYDELPDFRDPTLTPAERDRRIALRSEKIEFGSDVLFEPELALGYQFDDRTAVELSYVHLSHGQILGSGKNQGLDEIGVRLTRRFGD